MGSDGVMKARARRGRGWGMTQALLLLPFAIGGWLLWTPGKRVISPADHLTHGSPPLGYMHFNTNRRALYMDIVVHKGFTNQVFALLNGLAIAHLLNLTLVLPEMSTNYDYGMYAGADIQRMGFDASANYRVPMSEIFDTDALRDAVAPWVQLADSLPEHLQGDSTFSRVQARTVNPLSPDTLLPYLRAMQDSLVLRLKCPLSSVVWSTPILGQLRKAAIAALAPGTAIAPVLASRMNLIAAAHGTRTLPSFISLHLRVEEDWVDHCTKEPANPSVSQVESFEQCWADGETVAKRLVLAVAKVEARREEKLPRLLYVATGQAGQDFSPFYARGFHVLSPVNFTSQGLNVAGGKADRDLAAAVDYFLMRRGQLFVGNLFSSFSFIVRENYFYRHTPNASSVSCFYYNDPDPSPLLDITPTEALRWRVRAGIAYPHMYLSPWKEEFQSLACQQAASHSHQCTEPRVASLDISEVSAFDDGFATVQGQVRSTGLPWVHYLEVYGLPGGTLHIPANQPVYKQSPQVYEFEFSFLRAGQKNRFMVCTAEGGRASGTCTNYQAVIARPPLKRPEAEMFGKGRGTVYIYSSEGQKLSGGTQALHNLNAAINSEFSLGRIALDSVLLNGIEDLRTEDSVFVDELNYWDVGVNDVLVVSESIAALSDSWNAVIQDTGVLAVKYAVGQHYASLRDGDAGIGFQPICLTPQLSRLHGCPPKAILTGAVDGSLVAKGEVYRRAPTPKDNMILVGEDQSHHIDPNMIQVPGAEVVVLRGLPKTELLRYYEKAKIILDSYIAGRELALLEGVLFNVLPVVKSHAVGEDAKLFAVPPEWQWDSWDYSKLNRQLTSLISAYDENVPKLQPLIKEVESWPSSFPAQVSALFGDNVHIMLSALGNTCDLDLESRTSAIMSAVLVLLQYPFATVEVLVNNRYYFEYDFAGLTDLLFQWGMHTRLTVAQVSPEYKRLCGSAVFLQPPAAKQRKRHALLVPGGAIPFEADLITSLLAAAPTLGCDFSTSEAGCEVFGRHTAGGLLLVDQSSYYRATVKVLPHLPDRAAQESVLGILNVNEVQLTELPFFDAKHAHSGCAAFPLCSGMFQLEPWGSEQLRKLPPRCLQTCVCRNLTPILSTPIMRMLVHMYPDTRAVRNLQGLSHECAATAG